MTRTAIVQLLDDFALGGVTKGLAIFDAPLIAAEFASATVAVHPGARIAPGCDAAIILTHFPPNWSRLAFFASLRLRNPGARIVHVEHSYSLEWAALHVGAPRRFAAMLRLAFAMVDQLVCVSEAQRQWFIDLGVVTADKATVIYPVSPDAGRGALALPRYWPGKPLVIGAYGRYHHAKGFDRLIAAFQALPDIYPHQLLIGGYGKDEAALREAAIGDGRIRIGGRIDSAADFLAHCDLVAIPSRYETYGQVAQEAREAGRPILVSNVGGLPEQVGGAGLIVDFDAPGALARLLTHIDAASLARMAAAGRAATHDLLPRRAGEWLRLLRDQAGAGRGGRSAMPIAIAPGQMR
jgi:glycosyltransferase involved in cell wall biosynthesis